MRCSICGKESDVLAEGKCMSCYEASLVQPVAAATASAPTLTPRAPVAVATNPTPAVKHHGSWMKLAIKGTVLVIVALGFGSGIAWYTLYYKASDLAEDSKLTQANFILPDLKSTITQKGDAEEDTEDADTEEVDSEDPDTEEVTETEQPTMVVDKNADTDGDGLRDYIEERVGTDPTKADSDEDGLSDADEMRKHKTDALKADTDGDGASDSAEIEAGTDPKEATSTPPAE